MKHSQKAHNVFTAAGILACLALAIGWFAHANTVEAETKAFSLPRVYGFSLSSSTPGSMFATMHKSREVTTDPISFNFGKAALLNLGPGHGIWKYNANKNKVTITTFHADRDGSSKYWKIVQIGTLDENLNLTGTAKIFQYANIGELAPEATYESIQLEAGPFEEGAQIHG